MAGTRTASTRKKTPRPPQGTPAVLAGRVRDSAAAGENGVTLSGRCPHCGYLIGSPGHRVSCGLRQRRGRDQGVEAWTTATATSAGVYDSLLGGKDNNAADRAAVAAAEQAYPLVRVAARNNRAFLARAIGWAAQQGIRQFLDLGCGFPTVIHDGQGRPVPLTEEAAGEEARICYVDTSLLVVRFAEALRAGPGRTAHRADLRDADRIWQECGLDGWDLGQPVCVILGLVAQYFPAAEFRDITARYISRMQAGSVMIVSAWACADSGLASRLSQSHPADLYPHTSMDMSRFLGGTELVEPGVTWARAWRAGWGHERVNGAEVHVLGAVGVVP